MQERTCSAFRFVPQGDIPFRQPAKRACRARNPGGTIGRVSIENSPVDKKLTKPAKISFPSPVLHCGEES